MSDDEQSSKPRGRDSSTAGGKLGRHGLHYVAQMPKFLQQFQQKQQQQNQGDRPERKAAKMEDRDDNDDEQPVVVVADEYLLKEYQEQQKAQQAQREKAEEERRKNDELREKQKVIENSKFGVSAENAVVFRSKKKEGEQAPEPVNSASTRKTPAKRKADATDEPEGADERRKRTPSTKNTKLLSFGDEEDEEN